MILKNGDNWLPTDKHIQQWEFAYPQADVLGELRKMECWCDANPSKRKTSRGILRFCNTWLSRANTEAIRTGVKTSTRSTTLEEDLNDTSWAS